MTDLEMLYNLILLIVLTIAIILLTFEIIRYGFSFAILKGDKKR
jgi:hypothetical protein